MISCDKQYNQFKYVRIRHDRSYYTSYSCKVYVIRASLGTIGITSYIEVYHYMIDFISTVEILHRCYIAIISYSG